MDENKISWIAARAIYVGCTLIFAAITAACLWGAITSDEWGKRGIFAIGAQLPAWVAYRRIQWLLSEEARIRPSPYHKP
jgi:hypothetical protein